MMKYLSWPSKILFAMSASAYLLITFWLFWPYEPIVIHSVEITNQGDVYAGEWLRYQTNYTKETAYPVEYVVRQLVDGAVIVLASGAKSRLPVGEKSVAVAVKIPGFACEGTYHLHLTAAYQVNPIRTFSVTAVSEEFEIRRRDKGQLEMLMESRSNDMLNDKLLPEHRNNEGKYGVTDQAGN